MVNKKGYILQKLQVKQIFYIFFIIIVALSFSVSFTQSVHREVKTSELEQKIAVYRLFSSDDCLGSSGVINIGKFYDENLENCFDVPDNERVGVELKLSGLDGVEIGVSEINKWMVAQKVTCGMKGSFYDCFSTRKYVLIEDGGEIKQGILDILVVTDVK
ncbi:hypothetical protein K8R33_03715 [archaeon]|nr:hypothetical protein [archaeon]